MLGLPIGRAVDHRTAKLRAGLAVLSKKHSHVSANQAVVGPTPRDVLEKGLHVRAGVVWAVLRIALSGVRQGVEQPISFIGENIHCYELRSSLSYQL